MFQFSLRATRISCGRSVEEAAIHCGVSAETYKSYEINSGTIPKDVAYKIKKLYGIPLDLIFIGPEAECFEINRDDSFDHFLRLLSSEMAQNK